MPTRRVAAASLQAGDNATSFGVQPVYVRRVAGEWDEETENWLWQAVEPVLRAARFGPAPYAIKRYGEPRANEVRIDLS